MGCCRGRCMCEEPSGLVDWSVGGVELLSQSRVWERGESVRRAGVSSFGISGTNAHVIVEEAPVVGSPEGGGVGGGLPVVVGVSSAPAVGVDGGVGVGVDGGVGGGVGVDGGVGADGGVGWWGWC